MCYRPLVSGGSETARIRMKRGAFFALVAGVVAACSSDPKTTPLVDAGAPDEAGPPDGGGGDEAAAPACQDDDGFLPVCDAINGLAERQCDRATCDRYLRRMKTRVARRAIACMGQHITAGDSCRPCAADALKTSCVDPIATNACESLKRTCPARTVEECIPFLAGLSFGGRLTFVKCATEDNCLHDMPSCLP